MSETAGTFTCDNCGGTFGKVRPDEEAEAEAQELFPGIDTSDPEEAGIVCDDCFNHIMGRARAEAPELIGPGWRENWAASFPEFIRNRVSEGWTRNKCLDHCQDRGSEHAHLRTPDGDDVIFWADGRFSGYDLTQPARLTYPAARNAAGQVAGYDAVPVKWPDPPARTPFRNIIPRKGRCYRMGNGSMVHVKPECRCPR
jgi:hypothetical protein